jgi:hypothetical protein
MRLSDAGLHQRQTKAIDPNHRSSPWFAEDAIRDRSSRWLDTLRPVFMRDRQFRKNLVRNFAKSATLVSKPTVGAGSFARLYAKTMVGVNVPSRDIRRRNVLTPVRCCPSDTAPRYLNLEATTVDVELERQ